MPESISLRYDPLLLPTAQHRAGLAGLLVLHRALEMREKGPLPSYDIDSEGIVTLRLTSASLQTLVDDLFDAALEERQSQKRPSGTDVKNLRKVVQEAANGGRSGERFVFEVLVPKADFYASFEMPDLWRKLWREAVWATLRGRPTSRKPFEQRLEGSPVALASRIWAELSGRGNGSDKAFDLSEPLFIGAQSKTAERVEYRVPIREALLLHFWPIVTLVGQARQIKIEHGKIREDDAGFVFSIPDVADVEGFVDAYPKVVAQLGRISAGFRPRDALLAIPYEGALEYLHHLHRLASAHATATRLRYSITGVEVYHLEKRGNNTPILSAGRVEADESLAEGYEAIRGAYWSPLFRRQLILNLMRARQWFHGFSRLFDQNDAKLFTGEQSRPFAHDVSIRLEREIKELSKGGAWMEEEEARRAALVKRVRDIVRTYVRRRTESRTGLSFRELPETTDPDSGAQRREYPEKWREAQARVATEAFLAMRSRRSRQDFAEYFTGTLCSVPQYLPEDDYRALAAALLQNGDQWEDIRSLAMLAISPLAHE